MLFLGLFRTFYSTYLSLYFEYNIYLLTIYFEILLFELTKSFFFETLLIDKDCYNNNDYKIFSLLNSSYLPILNLSLLSLQVFNS